MWPSMFGPGWPWGVIAVATWVALMVAWLLWVMRLASRATSEMPPDDLWHRYEEGDLTHEEFERLRRQRAA
jgi:uncharacterized membrane protein